MPPAFSSTRQAAAFALLLLALLLLPVIVGERWLPPREQVYASLEWGATPGPYLRHVIFEEKGDIDIAFLGSSHMMHAIDTPYVQEKLSEALGRPAVVRSITWGGAGYDALYLVTKDLLENRRVRMLVFYNEDGGHAPNGTIPVWFRYGDNADVLKGLPLMQKAWYYLASVVGMPQNLLGLLRKNIPAPLVSAKKNYYEEYFHAENPATVLGALLAQLGFSTTPVYGEFTRFIPFSPNTSARASDAVVYSPSTQASFEFTGPISPAWKLHFAKAFAQIAQEHGTRLVMLHLPIVAEKQSAVVPEQECLPELVGGNITMLGIPPVKMYGMLSDDDLRKLYCDSVHMNMNGQEYFSQLITPDLAQIYESQTGY